MSNPITDQTAFRDRLDAAIDDVFTQWQIGLGGQRPQDAIRDAVLAVLPAPTDQAAVRDALRRADEAEARAAAMERGMESTAADALKHQGCHSKLMAQCQRAERAEAEVERLRTDRATVLREAADRIDNEELPPDYVDMFDNGARWAAKLLRRMADETAATEMQPRRGDQFEAWLKTQRDEHRDSDRGQWTVLDNVLDQYRLHADTGTPLSGHVCEGQAVGDCECLEQPANGARQDGAQS